jgi:hypothetical protein
VESAGRREWLENDNWVRGLGWYQSSLRDLSIMRLWASIELHRLVYYWFLTTI